MSPQQVQWELEGELFDLQRECDKLQQKADRTEAENFRWQEAEKRKAMIEKLLRERKLRGI